MCLGQARQQWFRGTSKASLTWVVQVSLVATDDVSWVHFGSFGIEGCECRKFSAVWTMSALEVTGGGRKARVGGGSEVYIYPMAGQLRSVQMTYPRGMKATAVCVCVCVKSSISHQPDNGQGWP